MWAERLARWSVLAVVVAGVAAVTSGALSLVWFPDFPNAPPDACTDPPCWNLDLAGASPLALLPFVAHLGLLGVALLLGGLSLLWAVVALARGRGWHLLVTGAVAVLGPILVLVGGEVLPHLLNPCALPDLAGAEPPDFCARTPEGVDVPDRWHLLYHALVGFLPLSLALGCWWRRRQSASAAASASR